MNEMSLVATILILACTICVREWQNRKERRELLDRIMSVDYQVFKRAERAAGVPARRHVVFPGNMSDAELAKAAADREGQHA